MLAVLGAGDLAVSQLTELEMKHLDQNVTVGRFRDREDYLTSSLKNLLVYGQFLKIREAEVSGEEAQGKHGEA